MSQEVRAPANSVVSFRKMIFTVVICTEVNLHVRSRKECKSKRLRHR
ncbi:unnamed protein product, partial [Amoebophrya sp. A120]|eukprot:GSA120T00011047001.1